MLGDTAQSASTFEGDPAKAVWLINERVANAWKDYVRTGAVGDQTPPPKPTDVKVTATSNGGTEITWSAEADLESGLRQFIIQRDGQEIGRLPEKPVGHFGRPLFQSMSYHDTPQPPLPALRFVDRTSGAGKKSRYAVIAINSAGVESEPSQSAKLD